MQKILICVCSIIVLSAACCCGLPLLSGMDQSELPEDSINNLVTNEIKSPSTNQDVTPTQQVFRSTTPTLTNSATFTSPMNTEELKTPEITQALQESLLQGLDPEQILDTFSIKYDLDCLGWSMFWETWSDECLSLGSDDPSYGFTVHSRYEETVDYIEAGVIQFNDPRIDVILNYFREVVELPYSGSSPDEAMEWIESELITLSGTPGDIRETSINGITYKVYGNIGAIWLEIGEIEQFIVIPED